jgi:hypothetical protein
VQCHLRHIGMRPTSLKAVRISAEDITTSFLAWQMALLISGPGAWQSIKEGEGEWYSTALALRWQFEYRDYSVQVEFA